MMLRPVKSYRPKSYCLAGRMPFRAEKRAGWISHWEGGRTCLCKQRERAWYAKGCEFTLLRICEIHGQNCYGGQFVPYRNLRPPMHGRWRYQASQDSCNIIFTGTMWQAWRCYEPHDCQLPRRSTPVRTVASELLRMRTQWKNSGPLGRWVNNLFESSKHVKSSKRMSTRSCSAHFQHKKCWSIVGIYNWLLVPDFNLWLALPCR